MAHGGTHAKEMVIEEVTVLIESLNNGHAGDAKVQGKALMMVLKMIVPLYMAPLVTAEEMESFVTKTMNEVCNAEEYKSTALSLGPIKWEGPISIIGLGVLVFLFMVGKSHNFW